MVKIFVYGSTLDAKTLATINPTARLVGKATLPGYELVFQGEYALAHPSIRPNDKSKVNGCLYEFDVPGNTKIDIRLGDYELQREIKKVKVDNKNVNATVYFLDESVALNPPSRNTYDLMVKGYEAFGFNTSILNEALGRSE